MWRLHTLLNYVRGGLRSGCRLRDTPSTLVPDDSDCQPQQQQQLQQHQQLQSLPSSAYPLVRTAAKHVRLERRAVSTSGEGGRLRSRASLWYVSGGLLSPSGVPPDPPEPASPTSTETGSWSPPAQEQAAQDPLSAARVTFAAESDRLMAMLQNSAGAGVAAQRPADALECFRRAAALGSAPGWYNTGVCFLQGTGTARDEDKAAVCFSEAAHLGHPDAAYNLALLRAGDDAVLTSQCRHDVTTLLQQAAAGGCRQAEAYLPEWRRWCASCPPPDDPVTTACPPGRSVSLPALSDSDPETDSYREWCGAYHRPGGGPARLLQETP